MNVKKVSDLDYSLFILECQEGVQWMSTKWVTYPALCLSLNVKVCKPALLLVILECQGVQWMSTKWVTCPIFFIPECQEGVQWTSRKWETCPTLCLSLNVKGVCKPALLLVLYPWMWVTCLTLDSTSLSEIWRTCFTRAEMLKSWVSDMWACHTLVYFWRWAQIAVSL